MSDDGSRKNYGSTSGNGRSGNDEQRAREQAYREYLRLRENSNDSRGHYVKDDTLYGAYFPSSGTSGRSGGSRSGQAQTPSGNSGRETEAYRSGSSIDDTPYGNSEMRKRRKLDELAKQQYMEERASARQGIAKQGRKNRDDADDGPEMDGKQSGKGGSGGRKGRKNGRGLKIALVVLLILVIGVGGVIAAGLSVVKNTLDNVGRVELDPDMIGINPQVDSELRNYRNIALIGIDARDMSNDEGVRSDAIIVASLNKETGEIKMFSVYRDTICQTAQCTGQTST